MISFFRLLKFDSRCTAIFDMRADMIKLKFEQ